MVQCTLQVRHILTLVTGGTFLRAQNLINVVVQVAPIGIVALGMMFAIITKGIDLSVGSTVALVAVVSGLAGDAPVLEGFFDANGRPAPFSELRAGAGEPQLPAGWSLGSNFAS